MMDLDRSTLWLSLMRRLTDMTPSWGVWKNAGSALNGVGDVDSVAPIEVWDVIEAEFRTWTDREHLGVAVVCRHVPRTMNLAAIHPDMSRFLQLEVKAEGTFRGSTLFDAAGLARLMEIDEQGFRRLRPGAEGVLKLVTNGANRGGRINEAGLRGKDVPRLLAEDPDGVLETAKLFDRAEGAVARASSSVVRGEWDRRAMVEIEAWALLRAVMEPAVLAERMRFRGFSKRRCPLLNSVYWDDRRVPAEAGPWLDHIIRRHALDGHG
jgi:hypothetical protein